MRNGEHAFPTAPTTLVLDGIWGNHIRMRALRSLLRQEIGPTRIWRYDNSGATSLSTLGERLASDIRRLDRPVHLVGYSMGGLVVRAALAHDPTLPVVHIVTMNTPHYGSIAAGMLPLPACRQMRPQSKFLRSTDPAQWPFPTLAVWCPADLMVLPGSSARWEKASRLHLCSTPAHVWPVYGKDIHAVVAEFLSSGK